MLCVVIPTLNSAEGLPSLLSQLSGHVDGLIVSDGGSTDMTIPLAVVSGAQIVSGHKGRGLQLARGAERAPRADWYLFLHSDVTLPKDWFAQVYQHMDRYPNAAGYFRFGANTPKWQGRLMEFIVGLRCFWWKLPYGDQGLLISRDMYDAVNGYPDWPLFEDVAIIDAIYKAYGRRGLRPLRGRIKTDISAYDVQGWRARTWRNFGLLRAYRRGVSVPEIAAQYT